MARILRILLADRLRSWIKHLILNALDETFPKRTVLICKDSTWEMEQLQTEKILYEIIELYIKGLNELVYFFPETSFAYAETMNKKEDLNEAYKKALMMWKGSDYSLGEGQDAYNYLAFKDLNLLNKDFADIAINICKPMIENQRISNI